MSFDGSKKSEHDLAVEQQLAEHLDHYGITPLDAVKLFPVLARRQWLKRFLAHAQLFQMTLEVPGDIAELGVYRGAGLLTWANLLEVYAIGDRTKVVWGFDHWGGIGGLGPEDGPPIPRAGKAPGGFDSSDFYQELLSALDIFDADRFVPHKPRVRLIHGQIEQMAPAFLDAHPGVRFSLVHFDCDLYDPTTAALSALWPRVSRGGLVLFDEYGIADWPGETQAVDEFLTDHPDLRLQTLPWTNAPAAYLIKP